jgi:hypothetical protein
MSSINWNDPKSFISKYFTVGEATYLPRLKMHYKPSEADKSNILKLALILDQVRDIVGKPFIVNVWIRPTITMPDGRAIDYNAMIGGAANSAHKTGEAVDFNVAGVPAEAARAVIVPHLEALGLRCEDGVAWIHLDCRPVPPGGHRLFKP